MRIYNREYDELKMDYSRMWNFLIDDYKDKKDNFIWTIGRLGDWKYGCWNEKKYFPNFMRKNAQLWLNDLEELIGFTISESCDNGFFVFAKRGYEFLYAEMIHWVKENWSTREGQLTTEVHEHQKYYEDTLITAGFIKNELCAVTRQYSLLYKNAWLNESNVTTFDLLRYEYNRESPCFNAKFDLSVVDENGRHISSCESLLERKRITGERVWH